MGMGFMVKFSEDNEHNIAHNVKPRIEVDQAIGHVFTPAEAMDILVEMMANLVMTTPSQSLDDHCQEIVKNLKQRVDEKWRVTDARYTRRKALTDDH